MNGVRVAAHQSNRRSESRKLVFDDGVAIGCGRRRNGAKMHHGVELAAVEPAQQVGRRHEVGELPAAEIAPLAVTAETIVDGNVGPPGLVEARNDDSTR